MTKTLRYTYGDPEHLIQVTDAEHYVAEAFDGADLSDFQTAFGLHNEFSFVTVEALYALYQAKTLEKGEPDPLKPSSIPYGRADDMATFPSLHADVEERQIFTAAHAIELIDYLDMNPDVTLRPIADGSAHVIIPENTITGILADKEHDTEAIQILNDHLGLEYIPSTFGAKTYEQRDFILNLYNIEGKSMDEVMVEAYPSNDLNLDDLSDLKVSNDLQL